MLPSSSARSPWRLFQLALATSLTISAFLYFLWSWRWPLVGDASLMHYIAFLTGRGWAPYRDLGDMNMPGSYLIEIAAMHLFGTGALAWRLFDFTLFAIATFSFFAVTRWVPHVREATVGLLPSSTNPCAPFVTASSSRGRSKLPGLFAASLFILIHGRDGLAQGGQRDLTMAVCLITATAFLFRAVRKHSPISAAAFGLLSGIAVTIKPTAILLTVAELALALYTLQKTVTLSATQRTQSKDRRFRPQLIVAAAAAYLIAPAIALIFLIRHTPSPPSSTVSAPQSLTTPASATVR